MAMREAEDLLRVYPVPLQFYDQSPECEVRLHQFEQLAQDRFALLKQVERLMSASDAYKNLNLTAHALEKELKGDLAGYRGSELRDNSSDHTNRSQQIHLVRQEQEAQAQRVARNRTNDHLSHFILRLVLCQTEEERRWMIQQEVDLFRLRCEIIFKSTDSGSALDDFLAHNDLVYPEVLSEELDENDLRQRLTQSSVGAHDGSIHYKVPFTEALDLVRHRKCYVQNGWCYVLKEEIVSLLAHLFKTILQHGLISTNKLIGQLSEDQRIRDLIHKVKVDDGKSGDFTNTDGTEKITPEMVKSLAERHFPLCMKSMQMTLNSTHHLKYNGRLQYGLFLKGAGLSMEDAIKFFRSEFTKAHVDPDKFDKEYSYGIRYNYGKEGKKVNFSPWSCMRIIMGNVSPGENHGCPYRHNDEASLKALLMKCGLEGSHLNDILAEAKAGHFQKACGRHYQATHSGIELSTGLTNHPNQFYMESLKGAKPVGGSKMANIKTEHASLFLDNQPKTEGDKKMESELISQSLMDDSEVVDI
eukprot:TCALIF_00178-PA protein Name:"Similar to Prim2 DNA primase large subunit (Rattus norvegicus)" AED:0.06 eAED:0.06 QI:0/0/0/0.5/1/1/2/0/528